MKTLRLLTLAFIASLLVSSCVVYEDDRYYEGKAYLSLFAGDIRPDYIDTDGALPSGFYWERNYQVYPGYYNIYYEYKYDNGYGYTVDSYEAHINIWIEEGRNVNDNYFNLDIWPDGVYEFYLKNSNAMQYNIGDIVKVVENTTDGIKFTATITKVAPRKH